MATWDEIQGDPNFAKLSPDEQAQFKQEFEAQNQSANVKAPSTSFEDISNTKSYQALSDDEKQQFQKEYQDAGGVINSGSGSTLTDIGNTINAGLASFGQSLSKADQGVAELAEKGLTNIGVNPDTAHTVGQYLSGEKQALNAAAKPEVQTEYKVNLDNARNTRAGRFAGEYGAVAGDIATMAVAPELAPVLLATKEVGSAYADQAPGEKSVGKALLSGTVNYASNKFLPMAGSKVLGGIIDNTLGRVIGQDVSEAATSLANKVIGQRATQAVGNVTKNAVAGAIGGAPAGAASAYARGQNVTEGAIEGLKGGLIFGSGSSALHEAGSALGGLKPFKAPTSKISDKVNENISKESETINKAQTHEERDTAFSNAQHSNVTTGLNVAQEHGLDLHAQSVAGNKAGQDVLGVKEKATGASVKDAKEVGTAAKEAHKSFKDDVASTNIANDAMFSRIKSEAAEAEANLPANSAEKKVNSASIKSIQDNLSTSNKLAAKGDITGARKYAVEAQKAFDKAPDHIKEAIQNGYQAPKGFTEGFDPVAHVHQMEATQGVFNKTISAAKNNAATGFKLPLLAHLGLEHVVPGFGVASHIGNKLLVGARAAQQATKAKANAEALSKVNKPTIEAKNEPTASDINWNDFGAKHSAKWMQSKVDQVKSSFADPKLAEKVTVDNVANENYVKGLMAQDKAQNREIQSKHIENVATRKATRQAQQQETAQQQVDDYFSNAGNYHDKSVKAQAIEKATKGGKLLNADRVIAEAQKITGNKAKAGTQEEFKNYVDSKTTNIDSAAKEGMKQEISKVFNGKSKLSHDEQKTLWKQIGDWESQLHEGNRSNAFAEAAKTKAEANVKRVQARQDAELKAAQVDETSAAMENELKDSGLSESDISDFINNHTAKAYTKAKNETQHKAIIERAKEVAREYADTHKELNIAQREEKVSGVSDDELKDIASKLSENKPLDDDESSHVQSTVFKSISEKVKAKAEGKTKVKPEHIESQINLAREKAKHFLAHNQPRMEATLRSLDAMEKGLKRRAANPDGEKGSWITSKDLNSIEGATAWGLQRQVVEAVTGENYDAFRSQIHGSETAERKGSLNTPPKGKGNAVKAYRIRKAKKASN